MRAVAEDLRRGGRKLGFVPTMGALHEGHLTLARLVKERGAECVFSVFGAPARSAPGEDFERGPRDLVRGPALLARGGVAAVFARQQGGVAHEIAGIALEVLAGRELRR